MATSPLPFWGPKNGWNCYVTAVFSGSPEKETKSEVAISPLPSRVPNSGLNCYVIPAFSGVPRREDKIKSGDVTHAFSGAQKWAELPRNPCVLRGGRPAAPFDALCLQ